MTSLAFILGVVPLVIATGASAKSQQTLGTGVLGGMITGTVLAIFMVPVFFVAVIDFFSRKGTTPRPPGAETTGETPPTRQLAEGQDARS
jgi:multidrug efflux pump